MQPRNPPELPRMPHDTQPRSTGTRVPLHRVQALVRRARWRVADRLWPRAPLTPPALPEDRPIRVGFVVCEAAKWGLGSVLAALRDTPGIETALYLTVSDVSLRLPPAERRAEHARQRDFFAGLGPIRVELYDNIRDRMLSSDRIDCDIAFIQQPWGMQDLPRRLSGRVRTAYVHYGIPVISNDRMQFGLPDFHPWLWRYYLPTRAQQAAIGAATGPRPPETCVTGHPKFDAYLSPAPARGSVMAWPNAQDQGRKRVIFAPHHALEAGSLGLGTFAWSGPAMLDLARRHPHVDFLLRPHPNMAMGLARSGVMQATQWATYRAEWAALPNAALFEHAPYWEVFRSSDAMITDSGSFLAEYLPTGRPLIRLERAGSAPLNDFGQLLADGFYRASDATALAQLLSSVVTTGTDPKAAARAHATARLMPFERPASAIIVDDILSLRNEPVRT